MTPTTMPPAELSAVAIRILCREIGVANTARFLGQFTRGFGNYTEERDEIIGQITMDEAIAGIKEIKRRREEAASSSQRTPAGTSGSPLPDLLGRGECRGESDSIDEHRAARVQPGQTVIAVPEDLLPAVQQLLAAQKPG